MSLKQVVLDLFHRLCLLAWTSDNSSECIYDVSRLMKKIFRMLSLLIFLNVVNNVQASSSNSVLYEAEPNNTPTEAVIFSGPATIMGAMPSNDQDGYMWSISDVDAQHSWSFELAGIADALTQVEIIRITFTDDGKEVASKESLFKFGSRDGSRPVQINELIFEPGDYLIAMARAGGGPKKPGLLQTTDLDLSKVGKTGEEAVGAAGPEDANASPQEQYRLNITKGKKLAATSLAKYTQDKPFKLRAGQSYSFYIEEPITWTSLKISDKDITQRWEISGRTAIGRKFTAILKDTSGKKLAQATTDRSGKFSIPDLGLEKGDYAIELEGSDGSVIRTLSIRATGQRVEGDEAEPNDRWELANWVDLSKPVHGRASKDNDYDYYRFRLSDKEEGHTRIIKLDGAEGMKYELCLLDNSKEIMQCREATGSIELVDLTLNADDYGLYVARSKKDAEYTLSMEQGARHKAIQETEPNDKFAFAGAMNAKRIVKGRFAGKDTDYYRFTVSGDPQLWRIQAVGDGISRVSLVDAKGSNISQLDVASGQRRARLSNLFLLPGTHHIQVKGNEGSYVLRVLPLGQPNPDFEREPNDDIGHAQILNFGQTRTGLLENKSADDYYRFQLTNNGNIRLAIEPPADGQILVYMSGKNITTQRIAEDIGKPAVIEGLFPPGDYSVQLRAQTPSDAEYRLKLERLPRFSCAEGCETPGLTAAADALAKLPVLIKLETETNKVAAYRTYGQKLTGSLSLTNQGQEALAVNLEAATSDYRWRTRFEQVTVEIPAGSEVSVPLLMHVPNDAWAGWPVRISVRAYSEQGAQVETYIEITADAETAAVAPFLDWSVAEPMLGGFNVAWKEMGGVRQAFDNEKKEGDVAGLGRYFHQLFDNQSVIGKGLSLQGGRKQKEVPVSVELAGENPIDVVGIILNPMGRHPLPQSLGSFELQLSLDGQTYESVLKAKLQPLAIDQSFVLDKPVSARYARLILQSSQSEKTNEQLALGEWKVIARPGLDISGGKGINIAKPELGGHVVWARPKISGNRDQVILTEKVDSRPVSVKAGQQLHWVIAFQDERAARITRLEWVDTEGAKPEQKLKQVKVYSSMNGPVGPWEWLTDWSPGESKTLDLDPDKETWARYLKFSAAVPEKPGKIVFPETLRVIEQVSDDQYRSIIGEWGIASRDAIYEQIHGLNKTVAAESSSANNSKETALPIQPGQLLEGSVVLAIKSEWYSVSVPDGQNTLELKLGGDPTVRTVLTLEDNKGGAVPVRVSVDEHNSHHYKATVEPGKNYFIKVEEPPRSVAFIWDNSGSVTPYTPMIYNAISSYVTGVVPGIDVANMMVLGGGFLLKDWSGEPYVLQSTLNDYRRGDNSSASEPALIHATEALADRPGTKAIVLVTDAETGRNDKELWPLFEKVRPRIFTIRVGSSHDVAENLMQSWANVNNGYYDNTLTSTQMDRAFDRARSLLRQPAAYTLETSMTFKEAPGPGFLNVVAKKQEMSSGAVELILDASGSMLKRLDGKRRINIAKEVLTKAVSEVIPAGTPVALRVFGHKKPNACQTDLEIKLKPLDPASAMKTISKINAKNLARTPIADSLAKVESDLRKVKGKKIVILVTDGEETCEGKPTEVLKKLAEKGFDIRLNIVGFAIDDAELKRQFEGWAEQGGGKYFGASDEASLHESVTSALQTPYTVYNQKGELVEEGTIGGNPLSLDAGVYRVKVLGSSPKGFEKVEITGEKELVLEY